jgi:hypothetical protein
VCHVHALPAGIYRINHCVVACQFSLLFDRARPPLHPLHHAQCLIGHSVCGVYQLYDPESNGILSYWWMAFSILQGMKLFSLFVVVTLIGKSLGPLHHASMFYS